MTPTPGEFRTVEWLEESLAALDRVYFDDHLADAGVRIGWMRWRPRKTYFAWGYCMVDEVPIRIEINRVLAWNVVPAYVVLETIYHEALHIVVGPEHDLPFTLAEKRFVHHGASAAWNAENYHWMLHAPKPF